MRLQMRGVDHHPLGLAALVRQRCENLVEHTQSAPANEPIVDRLMRAILRRRGDHYFVVASKGGAPKHPGWYRNILTNPDVEVQVGTKKLKARARTATGNERVRLWNKALEHWPPYAAYQRKTEREIPVIVLDPIH
jgi:deazaflavin-dependent oxidoreductase (nitroreductase family)